MNKKTWTLVGLALLIEGLFIGTDWTQFGIPSLYIAGVHFHHWMAGALILVAVA